MTVNSIFKIGATALVAVIALMGFGGSMYTIDEGARGVLLRNGAVVGTAKPGMGFKVPLIDSVVDVDVLSNSQIYNQVAAYSADQQTAFMKISVNYRVPPDKVEQLYSEFGSVSGMVERLVDRQVPEAAKAVFGKFNAATAIKERDRLSAEINVAIKKSIKGPVIIESVQLENLDFSDAYEKSIEDRMLAEVEVQKITQNAEREKVQAGIVVIKAQAEADSRLAQAKAEADAIKLRGEAEAAAIRVKGQAIAQNPKIITMTIAENYKGDVPKFLSGNGSNIIPFMNVDSLDK